MTTLVVEQPNYVPWLGYFDLLDRADVWVWYDDVQFTKRDWRNRNRVAAAGSPVWLTIPVKAKGHRQLRICDVQIDWDRDWARKHLATLRHFYGKAPFFDLARELMTRWLESDVPHLSELTIGLNEDICACLGIEAEFLRSSAMADVEGAKEARILSICRRLRASVYLSGPAARSYLSPEALARQGIDLEYILYDYAGYPRGEQPPRTDLSILDPLCWIGPEATRELIRSGRGRRPASGREGKG